MCEANDFLSIKTPNNLEKINIYTNEKSFSLEKEEEVLKKLLSIEKLKKIMFEIIYLDNNKIKDIPGENPSVTQLDIYWYNKNSDCILFNLQNKFPNISYFHIHSFIEPEDETQLEVIKNPNYKINELIFSGELSNIKFYCQPYEQFKGIEICASSEGNDKLKGIFPILSDNCCINFNKLTYFRLDSEKLDYEYLKNIYINIPKMPNLKHFKVKAICGDVSLDFYIEFIKKLLDLHLEFIDLWIIRSIYDNREIKSYSYWELKEINPDFKCYDLEKIQIIKLVIYDNDYYFD